MTAALHMSTFAMGVETYPTAATNQVIDASNEGLGWAFQTYSNTAITHVGFRYGVRTGTPPTYSVRLEGLTTAGLPDNTDLGGGSPTAVTFTPPADTSIDGLWQWKTLTNAYTPTRGQAMAIVVRYSSGTIDGSNNSSFTRTWGNYGLNGFPNHLINTSGTFTISSNLCCGWRTASGRHGYIIQSSYTANTAATAGHRAMMHFALPSGHGDTFRVAGIRGPFAVHNGGTAHKVVLTQSDGTLLQSHIIDGDRTTAGGTANSIFMFDDTTLATLSYGTKYYVGFEAVGSNAVGVRGVTLAEAEDREAWPNGLNRGLVMYNGSTYTETNTTLPIMDLILDDITEPAGGGVAIVNARRNTLIGR